MRPALRAGTDLINDVRALTSPGALQTLAAHPSAGSCWSPWRKWPRACGFPGRRLRRPCVPG